MAKADRPRRGFLSGPGGAPGLTTLRKLVTRVDGSQLCFGEPVTANGTTVIPVARIWAAGGLGYGYESGAETATEPAEQEPGRGGGSGGGGGGFVDAHPLGFITVGQDGSTRYEAIPDPQGKARAARLLASAAATLLTAAAASRALNRGATPRPPRLRRRRPAALLRRGSD